MQEYNFTGIKFVTVGDNTGKSQKIRKIEQWLSKLTINTRFWYIHLQFGHFSVQNSSLVCKLFGIIYWRVKNKHSIWRPEVLYSVTSFVLIFCITFIKLWPTMRIIDTPDPPGNESWQNNLLYFLTRFLLRSMLSQCVVYSLSLWSMRSI